MVEHQTITTVARTQARNNSFCSNKLHDKQLQRISGTAIKAAGYCRNTGKLNKNVQNENYSSDQYFMECFISDISFVNVLKLDY